MQEIRYRPIGTIRTPFSSPEGVPIQPAAAKGVVGRAELDPGLADGLKDLEGFSHVILIYHFDRARPAALRAKPYMDSVERGVFATRSPSRPNAIGISVVRLLAIEKNVLFVENVDIVDCTPLLDIKPYVPQFDGADDVRIGWLQDNVGKLDHTRDDGRFSERTTAVKGRQGEGADHE
jgi:tRNA-Thr(GGU) m(6)t(6)A37 methyltransferase TsaA